MGLLLLLAFLAAEIALLLHLIEAFGAAAVFLWMLGTGALGVLALRRQGLSMLRALQAQTAGGEIPARAVFDGLLVLAAGVLLVLPGILMDLLGLGLLFVRGLRGLVSTRLQQGYARRHPELRRPVTLEGDYSRLD